MKKLILIIIILINYNLKSQQLDSIRISNSGIITSLDTLFLNVFGLSDYGTILSKNYSLNANVINATVNTCSGVLYNPFPFKSIIKINSISAGIYKIKVALKEYNNTSGSCAILTSTHYDSLNINVVAGNTTTFHKYLNLINYSIYPNPFINELTLNVNSQELKKLILKNLLGQTVYQTEFYKSNVTLELPTIAVGAYIAEIYLNNQLNFRTKLIKQ